MKNLFCVYLMLLVVGGGCDSKHPSGEWRESRSLVRVWPRLQREKIERISFCNAVNWAAVKEDDEANDVDSWPCTDVPKDKLPECIAIIDQIMRNAKSRWSTWFTYNPVWPPSKMKIVTSKGKYIVNVRTHISQVDAPYVYGEDWKSYELGKFLVKCWHPDYEYTYVLPAKEDIAAILLYPRKKSPPLQ